MRNNSIYNDEGANFQIAFLKESLLNKDNIENNFIHKLNKIMEMSKKALNKAEINDLISLSGEDLYINNYLMPIILSYLKAMDNDDQISILKSNLNLSESDSNKMYFMLDLILELDVSVISVEKILQLLNKFKFDNDIVTLIFQYIDQFKLAVSQKQLLQVVHPDLPIEIRLQLLQVLSNIYGFNNVDKTFLNSFNEIEEKTIFIKDYFNYLKNNLTVKQKGLTVLQSMFYGDFEDSGKGNNGGLAVLLKSLGNEIATSNEIDLMVTITISKVKNLPFMHNYCNNHLFLRLPAYLNTDRDDVFLKREAFMKRFIKKHLDSLNINPDIYHIRYLDNASMAVAKLSKSLEKKLVLTLAPDPHRNVTDEFGHIRSLSFNQGRLISNKIRIGDYLINLSDKILGIGGQKVNDELRLYFPQFNLLTIEDKIKMIGEGIKIKSKNNSGKIQKVCELEQLLGIDQLFCQKPIILNVGRLADVKGQKALFNAFANSKLNETYNLLIIGGDIENPNLEEKATIDFFAKEIIEKPYLKSKFFHHAALPNDQVNIIESTIMQNQFDYPHIYLSSSIKEEFGLAILEAMSHGFLILGPIKGGVKTYVKNGENGFLIDTSNWETIARDTEKIIYDDNFTLDQFKAIQKQGQLTVEENFSIEKISKKFTKTYLALLGGKNNEV